MAMMKITNKWKAKDLVDDIDLEPKKADHTDWDVLIAVAKVLSVRFDGEKIKEFTPKATDDRGVKRKRSMREISNHRLLKKPMVINDQEENGQKHVIQKKRPCSKEVPYPPPDMPIEFVNKILKREGTDIMLVIQKVLSKSDCKKDQNRLFISILDAADFLKESEKALLQSNAKEVKQSIDVVLLPPNLEETNITLKQYNLRKPNDRVSQQYVLNKPWHDVVMRNGLAENTIIQIWSFRMDGQLGLAIIKLPTGGSNGTSTTSIGGATTESPSVSPSSLVIVN